MGYIAVLDRGLDIDALNQWAQPSSKNDPSMRGVVPRFTNKSARILNFIEEIKHRLGRSDEGKTERGRVDGRVRWQR
jgi:hypothetical protein